MSSAELMPASTATQFLRAAHQKHRPRKSSFSVSKTDLLLETLREEQVSSSQRAAREFIEQTLGKCLPSEDLHKSLQDGVLLCSLMNKLRPDTIRQISRKNLPFVKRENISNFLNAARKFGLHNSDLFETVDLFDGKDMDRVVATILAIARITAGKYSHQQSDISLEQDIEKSSKVEDSSSSTIGGSEIRKKIRKNSEPAILYRSETKLSKSYSQTQQNYPVLINCASNNHNADDLSIDMPVAKDSPTSYFSRVLRVDSGKVLDFTEPPPLPENSVFENANLVTSSSPPKITERTFVESERTFYLNGIDNSIVHALGYSGNNASTPEQPISQTPLIKKRPSLRKSVTMGQLFSKPIDQQQTADESKFSETPPPLPSPPPTPTLTEQKSPKRSTSRTKTHVRYKSDRTAEISINKMTENDVNADRISVYPEGRRRDSIRETINSISGDLTKEREKLVLKDGEEIVVQYQFGNCIGKGQFGSVYKALNLSTGQMVAVKRIKLEDKKEQEIEELMHEVALLKLLSHPSVVKYEGSIITDGHINIILEYVENGSLLHTLKSFGNFPEKLVVSYVVKILEGLVYLHTKQVVHCDLKAANILTTKNGNVKLSDFGVSLNLKMMEKVNTDVAGTPNWMAPEIIELKGASTSSDIWSLGCTIIELLSGKPPYADLLAMTALFRIVEDECPPLPKGISGDLKDFLTQCFQKDPVLRPTARELFKHRWIRSNWSLRELRTQESLPFLRRISSANESAGSLSPTDVIAANTETDGPKNNNPVTAEQSPPPDPSLLSSPFNVPGIVSSPQNMSPIDPTPRVTFAPSPPMIAPPITTTNATILAATPMVPHRFVKNSFGKPVECRICHNTVKKNAHICGECNMVCHQKCSPEAPWPCTLSNRQIVYTPLGVINDQLPNRLNGIHNVNSELDIYSSSPPIISTILANLPSTAPPTNKPRHPTRFTGKKPKKDDSLNSQSSVPDSLDSSVSGSSSQPGSPFADSSWFGNNGRPFSIVSTNEVEVNTANSINDNNNGKSNSGGSAKSRTSKLMRKKGKDDDCVVM